MEQAAGYVWEPIELSWSQKLAAFWAITWPTLLTMMLGMAIVLQLLNAMQFKRSAVVTWALGSVVYFACQVFWIPRLVEKRFRSFRIFAAYADGTWPKFVPVRDSVPAAVCVVLPQMMFMGIASVVAYLIAHSLNAKTFQSINLAALRILVVSPYSISFAMSTNYPKFRFRAYALRIAPP
jgi:hypothetical protein